MRVIDPERIARARRRRGYTQRNLAALANCTQAAISGLETGTMRGCSDDLARTIAKWLELDVEDLFEAHAGSRVGRVMNAAGSKRQGAAA